MPCYALFSNRGKDGVLREGCGDRHVIRIDGRLAYRNKLEVARQECIKRGFDAYQLVHGRSLLDLTSISVTHEV